MGFKHNELNNRKMKKYEYSFKKKKQSMINDKCQDYLSYFNKKECIFSNFYFIYQSKKRETPREGQHLNIKRAS